ncbi:MAG: IS630 family transposase [Actinobacteria bacterium]|nr:IS630 family transposase [Actinomycetota bacterium]
MRTKRFRVSLTPGERTELQHLISSGKAAARTLAHARILLKADSPPDQSGPYDAAIAAAVEVSVRTVERVRQRFVELGLAAALVRRLPTEPRQTLLDGRGEARLIAEVCSPPPDDRPRWTLQLLADRLVALQVVESISYETVRRTPKKNVIKPWLTERWCLPPQGNAAFVCQMEDLLDVYHRPYDPRFPQVCLDETSKQLVGEVRPPLPTAPGQPARQDYEYVRNGVANLFMICEPLAGWRHVAVTDQRTAVDFAHVIRDLVDRHYPEAERIVLVLDNLNTHTPASLYQAFPPEEAKRLADKLEWHYTPKHGSWLDMAEIELSVLTRQCLDQRIPDKAMLSGAIALWQAKRNLAGTTIKWRFTTADARIKLHSLYPPIQP